VPSLVAGAVVDLLEHGLSAEALAKLTGLTEAEIPNLSPVLEK